MLAVFVLTCAETQTSEGASLARGSTASFDISCARNFDAHGTSTRPSSVDIVSVFFLVFRRKGAYRDLGRRILRSGRNESRAKIAACALTASSFVVKNNSRNPNTLKNPAS